MIGSDPRNGRGLPASPPAFVLLTVVALAVAACMGAGDDNANGGLAGTGWTVVSVAGTATLPAAQPTIEFAPDGTIRGSDGCNQYTGRFRTEGDGITVGQLGSTLMGCEPLLMAQAEAFTQALTAASTWRQTETGELELHGQGDIVATAGVGAGGQGAGDDGASEPPPATVELAGSAWVLEGLGTVSLVDTVPTLEFGSDGRVSGLAGCNTFSGTYEQDAAALTFGPLATTRKACADPTMLVEAAYLAALAEVTASSIGADGRLTLEGKHALTFGPA